MNKDCYVVPNAEIEPDRIETIMISEAPPQDLSDYFYAPNSPFYMKTTAHIFRDVGLNVSSMIDILNLGAYITTAI